MVGYLRKVTNIKKIGHAGTLDPFATGLLIIGIGRDATKQLDEFQKLPKTYIATLRLGATSDTYDRTGKITETTVPDKIISEKDILITFQYFIGKQNQIPPMYSAKKVNGKKLYELARKGIEITRKPNKIEIFSIELLSFDYPYLKIQVHCSSGTYIRSLAHDIGQKLGVTAYCDELERTAIGKYTVVQAHDPKEIILTNLDRLLSL